MATRSARYLVEHPLPAVRQALADAHRLGQALAFVEGTEERGGRLFWRLPPPLATITGAEGLWPAVEVVPGDVVRWRAESPRLVSRGELRLAAAGPQATEIGFTLEMAGVGPARLIIEPLATLQIEAQMDCFIDRLQRALAAAPEPRAVREGV